MEIEDIIARIIAIPTLLWLLWKAAKWEAVLFESIKADMKCDCGKPVPVAADCERCIYRTKCGVKNEPCDMFYPNKEEIKNATSAIED